MDPAAAAPRFTWGKGLERAEREGTEITPAILPASKAWRLLLQIDSDLALKMNWGDGGRL